MGLGETSGLGEFLQAISRSKLRTVPDGTYDIIVTAVDAGVSQRGHARLIWNLEVEAPPEHAGGSFTKFTTFSSTKALAWFVCEMALCGIDGNAIIDGRLKPSTLVGTRLRVRSQFNDQGFREVTLLDLIARSDSDSIDETIDFWEM